MLDSITSLLATLGSIPRPFWAMLGGTAVAWGVTQQVKPCIPQRWPQHGRDVAVRSTSFAVGGAATLGLWDHMGRDGWVAALIVGLWSPATWDLLMVFIGWKWPGKRFRLTRYGKRLHNQKPLPKDEL